MAANPNIGLGTNMASWDMENHRAYKRGLLSSQDKRTWRYIANNIKNKYEYMVNH